jgi:hypothetical protein
LLGGAWLSCTPCFCYLQCRQVLNALLLLLLLLLVFTAAAQLQRVEYGLTSGCSHERGLLRHRSGELEAFHVSDPGYRPWLTRERDIGRKSGGTLNTWRSGDDGRPVTERLQVRY